jgi:hypothetical protein
LTELTLPFPSPQEERPRGYCWCGCGERTTLATHTHRSRGDVKGQPVRYISGHQTRKSPVEYVEEDQGYETPCWVWQRGKTSAGYGTMRVNGKEVSAHRFYYEREYGPIPEGMEPDHLCRVRSCVRPDHMVPATSAENTRRGEGTKLTPVEVAEIRRLRETSNLTYPQIGERFGVSRSAVAHIVARRTWKDIP